MTNEEKANRLVAEYMDVLHAAVDCAIETYKEVDPGYGDPDLVSRAIGAAQVMIVANPDVDKYELRRYVRQAMTQ